MGREIKTHCGGIVNDSIRIFASDPGVGGAPTFYKILHKDGVGSAVISISVVFHSGDPKKYGIFGITNEVLLAIVRDRLEGFQSGPFACEANKHALEWVVSAMDILAARSMERNLRGVEGQPVP